ncbi:MAG: TetR/AcrR family transcriptional regulator [Actinomycetota bacterium]
MAGLREHNKAKRVEAILDSAVELLGRHPLEDLTTEQIAAGAGVSTATVYNLVGTRNELLRALVDRVVEDLTEAVRRATARNDDPIVLANLIVDHSVTAFTRHSTAFRRIVAAGRSGHDVVGSNRVDPSQLQVAALTAAKDQGVLRGDVDPTGLGRQVFISWIGAMEHWASADLDDYGFGIAARHGLLVVLAAAATDLHRQRFLAELTAASAELERCWTRRTSIDAPSQSEVSTG